MTDKATKHCFFNNTKLQIYGVVLILLSAALLLWYGNATGCQAVSATAARVYFDGEYRIADGPWQKIVKGQHISSTQGDITLKGNFHLLTPDGEYIGIFSSDTPIAFYTDHINLTFREAGGEPYSIDHENPLYGDSACGVDWTAHSFADGNTEPIEILIHNPHKFGNETAVDELLSNFAIWTGIDFEKGVLDSGDTQRNIGLLFIFISFFFLGSALFSTLIHIKSSKLIWMFGFTVLFAGTYFTYSADGVSFWSESIVSNTTILGCSVMFYMFFISMGITYFLESAKRFGAIFVTVLGAVNFLFFALPVLTGTHFYDTWSYWAVLQIFVSFILFGCIVKECTVASGKKRLLYVGLSLPLVSFCLDVFMIKLGIWNTGLASKCIFIVFFFFATVAVLKIIPHSINALAKAKELETEKIVLNAQLAESRISTMMSQIHPHFIYNTLASIEQLCNTEPPKAEELVHNFAKYLRGNFKEIDNPEPILISQEMEHVRHYVAIETVRFPDMTFLFEMNSSDFYIPALTVQPVVENAFKHGLMSLQHGGTVRVTSYETESDYFVSVEDDGAGFDVSILLDERKHIGIRNIRGRLEAMVNGTLEIESTIGVGTKVLITIPKST